MLLDSRNLGAPGRVTLYLVLVCVALFLLAPIIFLMLLSLGSSQFLVFPPPHWTIKWYARFLASPAWIDSIYTSLRVAIGVAVLATALGVPASFALVRGRFPGRKLLNAYFTLPMIVPVIVVAIAVYSVFLQFGLNGTYAGFVLAHTILGLPFVIISVTTALRGFNQDIERAAVICGASPLRVKFTITLRSIVVGVLSGALFAFLISWDEIVVALFMASPEYQTLPIKMWTTLRLELNPLVAVAGTLLAALSIAAMGGVVLATKLGGKSWMK